MAKTQSKREKVANQAGKLLGNKNKQPYSTQGDFFHNEVELKGERDY